MVAPFPALVGVQQAGGGVEVLHPGGQLGQLEPLGQRGGQRGMPVRGLHVVDEHVQLDLVGVRPGQLRARRHAARTRSASPMSRPASRASPAAHRSWDSQIRLSATANGSPMPRCRSSVASSAQCKS
jgi:hypothetical protein